MKKKKIISIVLVVIWMILIFVMSSFGSTQSDSQSNFIVDILINIFNIDNVDVLSYIVRKLAHFTEYFILGILVCNMFRYYDKKYYFAIIVCILYAVSDEAHQAFVPGRSCQVYDMLIDSFGSLSGIGLISMFVKRKKIRTKGN